MMECMKLSEWARDNGVSRQSAARWFHAGILPVPARQLATGTILVDGPAPGRIGCGHLRQGVVGGSARRLGSSSGPLGRARNRSGPGADQGGLRGRLGIERAPDQVARALRDAGVGTVVVEHRDRLARFGVEYLEAALAAQGRRLVVVEDAEVADDLVRDMVEVLTSFCARLYGRRSAKRRARLAVEAAGKAA
jgi:putative resolvase